MMWNTRSAGTWMTGFNWHNGILFHVCVCIQVDFNYLTIRTSLYRILDRAESQHRFVSLATKKTPLNYIRYILRLYVCAYTQCVVSHGEYYKCSCLSVIVTRIFWNVLSEEIKQFNVETFFITVHICTLMCWIAN